MSESSKNEFVPIVMDDYIPSVVKRLIHRIQQENYSKIALYGFGDNMKWI